MKGDFLLSVFSFLVFNMIVVNGQSVVQAVFIEKQPVINGILDDEIWSELQAVNEFIQREPYTGEPVTEKTEFYFCYDNNNLYIGVRCFSDPSLITAKEMARDVDLSNDDRIQVILDTYLDKRNAYWFQIGPRGSPLLVLLVQMAMQFPQIRIL